MKKIFLFILVFIFSKVGISQWPVPQTLGRDSTIIGIGPNYGGGIKGNLICASYTDTTAANLLRVRQYGGALIFTTSDGLLWTRNSGATAWINIGGGSLPSGSNWKIGGNLLPVYPSPYARLGTLTPWGGAVSLMTNSVDEVVLNDGGLALLNDTTNTKIMTINPTTKVWGRASWNNGSTPISSLTAATAANNIDISTGGQQTWTGNSTTIGSTLALSSTSITSGQVLGVNLNSTAAFGNSQSGVVINTTGVNSTASQTTFGAQIGNTHSGTGSVNVGLSVSATSGATNYAARFLRGKVAFGVAGTESGILEINGATSGTVTLQPANAAGTYTLTLPTSDGGAGEFLQTDGSGVLTWAAAAATPAGNFGNVQLNRNSAFATPASDSLDYEAATGLTVKAPLDIREAAAFGIFFTGRTTAGTAYLTMNFDGNNGVAFREARSYNFYDNGNTYLTIVGNTMSSTDPAVKAMSVVTGKEVIELAAPAGQTADILQATVNTGIVARILPTGGSVWAGRVLMSQGADVASAAGAISLGTDGNSFEITGTASITLISNVNWQNGSVIYLIFTSTATLVDGTANSGTDIGMELAGGANFTGSADDVVTLILSEVGGVQRFREVSRSVN